MSDPLEFKAAAVQRAYGEVPLCPNCLSPGHPAETECAVCLAPTGTYAAWMPYERIWAAAWIGWKATWCSGLRRWHAYAAAGLLVLYAVMATVTLWLHGRFALEAAATGGLDLFMFGSHLAIWGLTNGSLLVLLWRALRNARRTPLPEPP